jgi:hypothetical protein
MATRPGDSAEGAPLTAALGRGRGGGLGALLSQGHGCVCVCVLAVCVGCVASWPCARFAPEPPHPLSYTPLSCDMRPPPSPPSGLQGHQRAKPSHALPAFRRPVSGDSAQAPRKGCKQRRTYGKRRGRTQTLLGTPLRPPLPQGPPPGPQGRRPARPLAQEGPGRSRRRRPRPPPAVPPSQRPQLRHPLLPWLQPPRTVTRVTSCATLRGGRPGRRREAAPGAPTLPLSHCTGRRPDGLALMKDVLLLRSRNGGYCVCLARWTTHVCCRISPCRVWTARALRCPGLRSRAPPRPRAPEWRTRGQMTRCTASGLQEAGYGEQRHAARVMNSGRVPCFAGVRLPLQPCRHAKAAPRPMAAAEKSLTLRLELLLGVCLDRTVAQRREGCVEGLCPAQTSP